MYPKRLKICAGLINKNYANYSLLDLGCRTMDLKPLLSKCNQYHGTDLISGPNIFQCNLENGLPQFKDSSFDVVTVLDVLEHLDKPHYVLEEALRVAKSAVFVSLPNMFNIKFRLNFLKGNGISKKYDFPPLPILDRHRWILSFTESVKFIHKIGDGLNIETYKITPQRGRTKMISSPVDTWLSEKWPDLFAVGSLFMIKK